MWITSDIVLLGQLGVLQMVVGSLTPQVIDLSEDDKVSVKPLMFTQTYATEQEAEQARLSMAQEWIDKGKPTVTNDPRRDRAKDG
jgi:hypothetical protein